MSVGKSVYPSLEIQFFTVNTLLLNISLFFSSKNIISIVLTESLESVMRDVIKIRLKWRHATRRK